MIYDIAGAKDYIHDHTDEILELLCGQPIGSHDGYPAYVCAKCKGGDKKHNSGLVHNGSAANPAISLHCNYAECGFSGDVIAYYQMLKGVDFKTAIIELAAMLHISVDVYSGTHRNTYSGTHKGTQQNTHRDTQQGTHKDTQGYTHNEGQPEREPEPDTPGTDYRHFFLQAHGNIGQTAYHRGLSAATLDRFNVGYVAQWRYPLDAYLHGNGGKDKTGKPRTRETWERIPFSPRLIIPTSAYSYLARDTRPKDQQPDGNIEKSKVGRIRIFNADALRTAQQPIFIVEGEIDALSIIDVGGEAVGMGSTAYAKMLIAAIEEKQLQQPLILALDNDPAGAAASGQLIAALDALHIRHYSKDICSPYKDANEALCADREAFRQRIAAAIQEVTAAESAEREAERAAYLKTSTAHFLDGFIGQIADSVNTPYIPTGFSRLDAELDGGLYEGLYIIGAISSLGKTTYALQIADQIAQQGQDVLIFSLEMARNELMSKSISRSTIQQVITNGGNMADAKTARGITDGKRYSRYSAAEMELIKRALDDYGQYAQRLYIREGMGDLGAADLREAVERHISFTGNRPVAIIDYLQLLAPYDVRASDKQNTDRAVLELKRISRDFKIPVICISSFNRDNYNNPVSYAAFKESGAIEYSSDVLIGLQLRGVGTRDFDAEAAKQKNPREVEAVILKNRNGKTGAKLSYNYYAMFNLFEEI